MPRRRVTVALVLAAVVLLALAGACDDGEPGGATPTPAGATTETPMSLPSATLPAPQAIRDEDLATEPGLRQFLDSSGGVIDETTIIYADLTADGIEEAVVPVGSGGEGGDIAVFVLGYTEQGPQDLLQVQPGDSSLRASVNEGVLEITEPVFEPGDAMCCPSNLRITPYEWDGQGFVPQEPRIEPAE